VTRAATVIVCAYTERRWPDLVAAVGSVRAQTAAPAEVVLVVDHDEALLARARETLRGVRCLANRERRGLSGARNTAIAAAGGDVLAFLDDDAVAEPEWLERLLAGYDDPRVLAAGGAVLPRWDAGRPPAFPPEFDWVVGCTYRGMPEAAGPVRNVIGANMSFRRDVLAAVGGFREDVGRVGAVPIGCEETELCLRARRRFPDGVVLYEPRAVVHHRVPAERASWRYFAARCYAEGRSKAQVCRLAGARGALQSERAHVAGPLRAAVTRDVTATVHSGDLAALARVGAVAAGVSLASAGLVAGRALPASRAAGRRARAESPADLRFAIHDRVGLRVAAGTPGARQLQDMLAPFATGRDAREDLVIGGRVAPQPGLSEADGVRWGDGVVELPARGLRVRVEDDRLTLDGDGELLVPTLALLDHAMVRRGAAMVHAAAVCRDGRGVCIAGAGGVGKTSAALTLARDRGDGFMADDWCFLAADGRLLGYAKPLFLRPHHRAVLNGGARGGGRAAPLAPAALTRPLGAVATAVHPVIVRRPGVARAARRVWPEYRIVPPREALGDAAVVEAAPLAAVVYVERAACDAPVLESRRTEWMADRLAGGFHAALPRGARDLLTAMAGAGAVSLARGHAEKAAILCAALHGRPALLLRVPLALRAPEAAAAIAAAVDRALDLDGHGG
jgi:glucosyl-dolichyl phosphate glucuronosyltransferase